MAAKPKQEAQQPLILRAHRLMEAFAKSDDERDFYLDRLEGFIIYIDLDKAQEEIEALEEELATHPDRFCSIPKLTFYEAKKFMEGFVNEKVYDIDTKEKLLDIIQAKEARSNFLEFIYDHHSEFEKWQQYYQERSRVRIIEWLRQHHFHFVFEEDLEFSRSALEKLKQSLFDSKVGKDIQAARKLLITKAKSYYSNEALNPRPKRGRPPKQAAKLEIEPQITSDIYLTVPSTALPFLFTPDISSASSVTFSADFDNQHALASRAQKTISDSDATLANLQKKLASLREISSSWTQKNSKEKASLDLNIEDEEDDEDDFEKEKFYKPEKKTKAVKPSIKSKEKASAHKKNKPKIATIEKGKTKAAEIKKKSISPKGNPGRKQKHKRIIPMDSSIQTKPLRKLEKMEKSSQGKAKNSKMSLSKSKK